MQRRATGIGALRACYARRRAGMGAYKDNGIMQAWKRRSIGILDIGGSGIGILAILSQVPHLRQPADWIICAAFAALYGWGIYCGTQLLEGRPNAARANRAFWLAQVPAFNSPWASYVFTCGFHLTAGVEFAPVKFGANFMLGSRFMFTLFRPEGASFLGLNLFALAIALVLAQQLRRRTDAGTEAVTAPPHDNAPHGEP
ncbi:hypothetical protein QE400_002062 [Xanthomonas sacchari]|uniref:hypothetical protein n=1 Tax=Xanthomonas sacchari TaxID=56458 RepID=UPI00277DD75A|nr:hypothetical protein [Xanthomonas sacchari]MDQ1092649.1 hypothetical protein [Xanthomonas sacchari]